MSDLKGDVTLDAKGLSCPMPLLRTKKEMGKLSSGQVLEVLIEARLGIENGPRRRGAIIWA